MNSGFCCSARDIATTPSRDHGGKGCTRIGSAGPNLGPAFASESSSRLLLNGWGTLRRVRLVLLPADVPAPSWRSRSGHEHRETCTCRGLPTVQRCQSRKRNTPARSWTIDLLSLAAERDEPVPECAVARPCFGRHYIGVA
eukprot:6254979-Amphidinium_carterae.3